MGLQAPRKSLRGSTGETGRGHVMGTNLAGQGESEDAAPMQFSERWETPGALQTRLWLWSLLPLDI